MIREAPMDPHEVRWDEAATSYQVEFWTELHRHVFCVVGAEDVTEVIAWAQERADGRDITIYAEVDRGRDHGRVRLLGIDPTWGRLSETRAPCEG